MKKLLSTILFICLAAVSAMAVKVTGVVYDTDGEPAIGASVVEKGKPTNGVATDIDGKFSLNVPSLDATLIISFIGMETQEVALKGRDHIEVTLQDAAGINLDEIVIVGYGTQKKINATGAVKTIDSEVLESRPLSNAVQGLQGAIAGLNITNDAGGGLGQSMAINIRGAGSIGDGSNSSPLVLIDGMEGDLSTINPNDIANISVLKDAAAASIYGSRAPFGVILVTTKNGNANTGVTVSYTGNVRMAQPISVPHMVNGYESALMTNDAYLNSGGSAPFSSSQIEKILGFMRGENEGISESAWEPNHWYKDQASWASTDWYDVHLKDLVVSQEHNASVSGGTEKVNYYFSGNYLNQNGLFRYADENYERLTLTGKVNMKFNKYVSFQWTSRIIATDNKKPSALDGLFYHNLGRRYITLPVYLPSDSPAAGTYHYQSLIPALQDGGDQIQKEQQFYNQANLIITPLENWNIHAEINSRIEHNPYTRQFKPLYQILPDGSLEAFPVLEGMTGSYGVSGGSFNVQPDAGDSYYERLSASVTYFSTNFYTDYMKKWGSNEFRFLVGMQTESYSYHNLRAASWDIAIDDRPYLPSVVGSENSMMSEKKGRWTSMGFFGRINWNFDDRYMAEINLRADGASRFPSHKRWACFPSFSAGWNVAQEKFWEPLYSTVNTFKLRASYGTLGNQNTTSYYPYFQSMTASGGSVVLGGNQATVLPMYAPYSTNITWETVKNINVGVDLGLFNNRLVGLFEWYQRTTSDMVGPSLALAGVFGADAPKSNNAELRTRGWEAELTWRDNIGKDFNYSITATLSDYQSVVTKYETSTNEIMDSDGNGRWYPGKNPGDIWGYKWVGIAKSDAEMQDYLTRVDQSALGSKWGGGDVMYADLNGDGRVNNGSRTLDDPGDMVKIGNSTPRFAYSFTLSAQWKFIDARVYIQGIGKRDYLFSGSAPFFGIAQEWQRSLYKEHLDYYRYAGSELGANLDPYYARPRIDGNNIKDADHFVQDASYLRLKNVQIGVSLPQNTKLAKYVKRARLYVSGENLFTHTNLRIFDPESISGDWGAGKAYPNYRTWSVGLELTF